jgi:hypothetical protein
MFRSTRGPLPAPARQQRAQQIRCLSLYFQVGVVEGSCDFDEECTAFEPDMVLFESGDWAGPREYRNIHAHPQLLRLGLLNAEPFGLGRTVFMADMARWHVDQYCTPSVVMAEYFAEIAASTFVWANCIDPRGYNLPPEARRLDDSAKTIPVLFTGPDTPGCPWQARMRETLTPIFPTLTLPQADRTRPGEAISDGAALQEMLRASWFVPSCSTIARDVLRQHFEIPAAGACLVAEPTASLAEAGFVDMENCVLADSGDVVDKLNYLLARRELLVDIIDCGRALVMDRHTMENRDQVLQWYRLRASGGRSGRIVQEGPFGGLALVDAHARAATRHVTSGGLDRALLRQADSALRHGSLAEAEILCRRCLDYHAIPEALLRLAICDLKAGRPNIAEQWLSRSIDTVLGPFRAPTPDPVEWAYFIRTSLYRGDVAEALARAAAYPQLGHPELDRIRMVLEVDSHADAMHVQPSVHHLPATRIDTWLADLTADLNRAGHPEIAAMITRRPAIGPITGQLEILPRPAPPVPLRPLAPIGGMRRRAGIGLMHMRHHLVSLALRLGCRNRPGPFHRQIEALARRPDIRNVLVLGADPRGRIACTLARASQCNGAGPVTLVLVRTGSAAEAAFATGAAPWSAGAMIVLTARGATDPTWVAEEAPRLVVIEAVERPDGGVLLRALCASGRYHVRRIEREGRGFAVLERGPAMAERLPDTALDYPAEPA